MKAEKIEKIRFWMGSKLPKWLFNIAVWGRHLYKNIKMPEKRKHYGELNPDKTFYVIRLCPPATGFGANYIYVLGYLKYALEKGWIPVIDMMNYETLYQEKEAYNGTRNVWEYFFEQPLDSISGKRYSLDEVYKSKNVILAKADDSKMYDNSMKEDTLKWQHEMSKLVPFNSNMKEYVMKIAKEVLPNNKKILGVPTRGSDVKKRVIGHPIPLDVKEMLPIIKARINKWNIDHIFVTAEEVEAIEIIKNEFEKVSFTERPRLKNFFASKNLNAPLAAGNSKAESLKGYLTEIYLLSCCTNIIGTKNNGINLAAIWNGGLYEHIEIIDNGFWK